MTDAEKAALKWLDNEEFLYAKMLPGSLGYHRLQQIRTIKAFLAEPRLPAALTDAQVEDIWQATPGGAGRTHRQYVEDVLAGIRDALTKPATKTVEVWRVEWAYAGQPLCSAWASREGADREAMKLRNNAENSDGRWACIHVTGPHKQEVPND